MRTKLDTGIVFWATMVIDRVCATFKFGFGFHPNPHMRGVKLGRHKVLKGSASYRWKLD